MQYSTVVGEQELKFIKNLNKLKKKRSVDACLLERIMVRDIYYVDV